MAMGIVRTPIPIFPFKRWMIVSVFLQNSIKGEENHKNVSQVDLALTRLCVLCYRPVPIESLKYNLLLLRSQTHLNLKSRWWKTKDGNDKD